MARHDMLGGCEAVSTRPCMDMARMLTRCVQSHCVTGSRKELGSLLEAGGACSTGRVEATCRVRIGLWDQEQPFVSQDAAYVY